MDHILFTIRMIYFAKESRFNRESWSWAVSFNRILQNQVWEFIPLSIH